MEKLLELEELVLIPSERNVGRPDRNRFNMTVVDVLDSGDYSKTLPIFTAPLDSIVKESNIDSYLMNGIKPILPLSEPLSSRLRDCIYIFSSFTINEVRSEFLSRNEFYRNNQYQYHICIETGNGHENALFSLCSDLKKIYGAQVIVMGGNLLCPETYSDYSKAFFDYVRVGSSGSTQVNRERFGFHYPLASLLDGIKQYRKTSGIGLNKQVKIVADGGITSALDAVKAIALGADYVMCGSVFAHCIEASGQIIQKSKTKDGRIELSNIDPKTIISMSGGMAELNGYYRRYTGNTHPEICSVLSGFSSVDEWNKCEDKSKYVENYRIEINNSIPEWLEEFKRNTYYAFMMTGSTCWEEFKSRVRYASVNC